MATIRLNSDLLTLNMQNYVGNDNSNYFRKCWRCFDADTMKIFISALGLARKFKFSSYVQLLSVKQIFQYSHARLILCNVGEVYISEHGLYILPVEHARMLILSNYVLMAPVSTIHKYCQAWVI